MWPLALKGLFPKELEGTDELGGGLAGNFLNRLEMDAVLADLFEGDQLGRAVIMFTQLTDTGVVTFFGPRADGQKFEIIGEGF